MAGEPDGSEEVVRGMFGPDVTFLGVPRAELDSLAGYDVVFIGAPYDAGTSHRPGARFGPQAIRMTDYLPHDASRPHLALGVDPLAELRCGDIGDVVMPPVETDTSLRRLETTVQAVADAGAIPVILGGDHTITFPDATGVARHVGWGRLSLIHFDAHADTGDTQFGSLIGHGTPMRRLIESGAVRGDRFLQIGLRGYWPEPPTLAWMAEQRMRSFEMTEIVTRGLDECLTEAFGIATDECDGVFLSVDVDVVDPGMAPGTGTPEPGGLTARQLLDAVRRIAMSVPLAGVDVVEVSPPFDHAEVTAFLGNRVVLEALSGIAWRRRQLAGEPVRRPDSPLLEGRERDGRASELEAEPCTLCELIGTIYSRSMLDVTRLRVLVAVARSGSVTAAARELNYAQPSVSHHLARLEAETGIKLIQRAGRGIRLTDAGRLLAERAAEVIGRLDAAENELAAYTGLRAGRLRLAAFPSALGTIVPAAAAMLHGHQPSVDLRLTEAEPPEALRMLRAGYVDVALVFRYSPDPPGADAAQESQDGAAAHRGPVAHGGPMRPAAGGFSSEDFADEEDSGGIDITEGLRERLILDEPVHLVTSPAAAPSAHGAELNPNDLAKYARHRWIAGCDRCRANLLKHCAMAGFIPKIAFTTDDYVAVQALVAADLGVSTLPGLCLRAARHPGIKTIPLAGARRHVFAVRYGDPPDPPAVSLLMDVLRAAAEPARGTAPAGAEDPAPAGPPA